MDNQRSILRCTIPEEELRLPRSRCALLLPDLQDIPDGYGAYIVSSNAADQWINNANIFAVTDNYEVGDFLLLKTDSDGSVHITPLLTSDKPERTLFLTGQCNSDCIMCPYATNQRIKGEPVPVDDLLAYVELMNPETDYICITGGEPTLLKEGFLAVLKAVKDHLKYAVVHILTNGRTFSYPDFFTAYQLVRPYQTLLGIPLHAATPEHHDRISGVKGSFTQTVCGIENCYKGREQIELRIVTSALNAQLLSGLAHFIGKNFPAVNCVSLMGLEMMGNAMINRSAVWIGYDQLMPYVEEAANILLSYGVSPRLFNYPLCKVQERYHSIYHRSITESKVRYKPECEQCSRKEECGGFFQTTIVMPDINVSPYR